VRIASDDRLLDHTFHIPELGHLRFSTLNALQTRARQIITHITNHLLNALESSCTFTRTRKRFRRHPLNRYDPKPFHRLTTLLRYFDPRTHRARYHCSVTPRSSYTQKSLPDMFCVSCLLTCTAYVPLKYASLKNFICFLWISPKYQYFYAVTAYHVKNVSRPLLTCAPH